MPRNYTTTWWLRRHPTESRYTCWMWYHLGGLLLCLWEKILSRSIFWVRVMARILKRSDCDSDYNKQFIQWKAKAPSDRCEIFSCHSTHGSYFQEEEGHAAAAARHWFCSWIWARRPEMLWPWKTQQWLVFLWQVQNGLWFQICALVADLYDWHGYRRSEALLVRVWEDPQITIRGRCPKT